MSVRITYSPEIRKDSEIFARIDRATSDFSRHASDIPKEIAIHWGSLKDEDGKDLIRLALTGWTGEVHADLQPHDLTSEQRIRRKLRSLFDQLLSIRTRVLIKEVDEMLSSGNPA
jgi:hypothetical protein